MNLNDYSQYDGLGLAELVKNRDATKEELTICALAANEKVNPEINAVMNVIPEELRRGDGETGPFAGVPFLIKDVLLQMKGVKSESCSSLAEGATAEKDSFLMAKYRQAGLVTVGRTASPEWGFNAETASRFNGPTRNPWNLDHSAGGSSGGAAAAVAAGVVPMAHASDGGGSIRIPSGACGLVGMKPTRGRTSVAPDLAECLSGLGIEHVITKTVRDSAAMLDATEGPAPGDLFEIARPETPFLNDVLSAPRPLKIAWTADSWVESPSAAVVPEVAKAVETVADLLQTLNYNIENKAPVFDKSAFWDATGKYWAVGIAHWIKTAANAFNRPISLETLETSSFASYEHGAALSATDFLDAQATMNGVCRQVSAFFQDFDVLVTPTVAKLPLPSNTLDANRPGWTLETWSAHIFNYCPFTPLFNATGQPAISLPLCQSNDGLPIGIQFVANFGREDILYNLAAQLEKAMPWRDRRPPVYCSSD